MTARKIIIDTDPGIDDAMAIFYALAAPELEVIGLTTIFGNAHVEVCTANAIRLLDIAGRAYVLENGTLRFEGTPAELLASPELKRAYLGL